MVPRAESRIRVQGPAFEKWASDRVKRPLYTGRCGLFLFRVKQLNNGTVKLTKEKITITREGWGVRRYGELELGCDSDIRFLRRSQKLEG
jgi:hypothetical protein